MTDMTDYAAQIRKYDRLIFFAAVGMAFFCGVFVGIVIKVM